MECYRRLPPGDLSRRNRALYALLPWRLVKLKELPATHKRALVAHGIWPKAIRSESEGDPVGFIERVFGKNKIFGVVDIPIEMLRLQVMNDPDRRLDFRTFTEYHHYFCKVEHVPKHPPKNRWPVILSGRKRERETILDGWHRFHSYHESGAKKIPAIWYADE
jgi:hypothetical protein